MDFILFIPLKINCAFILNKNPCPSNKIHIYFSYYQWNLTNLFLFIFLEWTLNLFRKYILWIDFSCLNGIYLFWFPNCHIKKNIDVSVKKNLRFLENTRNKIKNKTFKIPQSVVILASWKNAWKNIFLVKIESETR